MDYKGIDEQATLFGVLADPTRLKLLRLLARQREPNALCVNALAYQLGVTQSAVSQHLRILKSAGLVKGERRGYRIHYFINQETLIQAQHQISTALNLKEKATEIMDISPEKDKKKSKLRRYHEDATGIESESL